MCCGFTIKIYADHFLTVNVWLSDDVFLVLFWTRNMIMTVDGRCQGYREKLRPCKYSFIFLGKRRRGLMFCGVGLIVVGTIKPTKFMLDQPDGQCMGSVSYDVFLHLS